MDLNILGAKMDHVALSVETGSILGKTARRIGWGCGAALLAAVGLQAVPPAYAAETAASADQLAAELPAGSVCLSKVAKLSKDDQRRFVIAVPAEAAERLLARGFVQAECGPVRRMPDSAKSDVCSMAQAKNFALDMLYWTKFSLTPEESCKLVRGSDRAR